MAAEAIRWSCARCQVSVGRMDASPSALPDAWTRSQDLVHCLSCSRALAADAAMELLPESTPREDRVRLRRSALIGFEIERSPDSPDRVIAGACRTSPRTVAAVRAELDCTVPAAELVPDHALREA